MAEHGDAHLVLGEAARQLAGEPLGGAAQLLLLRRIGLAHDRQLAAARPRPSATTRWRS
jgi:hypothetical protein